MISVIIPHFNQPDHLARCLDSLVDQTVAGHDVEIIVVDNNSRTLPEAVVAAFPDVRLISETEAGPGLARNTGVAACTGDILAFIDADCIAHPGWLSAIATRIAAGQQILGGDVRIHHRDATRPTVWEAYESEFAYRMEYYIRDQGFTGTGNLAMTRAVFEDVGPFGGIGIAEDRDWGQRASAKGYVTTWAPDMRADHPARESFAELARKWDRQTGHDFEMYMARPQGRIKWLIRSLAMVVSPLATLPRILRSTRINGGLTGRFKAFAGLTAIRAHRSRRMLGLALTGRSTSLSNRWREDET